MEEPTFGVESPLFVGVRATLSLVTVTLVGVLALRWLLLPRYRGPNTVALVAAIDARARSIVRGLGIAAIVAMVAKLVAQSAAVFGPEQSIVGASLHALLFRAAWGHAWWLAFVAACTLTYLGGRRRLPTPRAWIALALSVLLLAASQPMSGHPAAAVNPWVAIAVQSLHIVAAGAWIGTLGALTFVAIPAAATLPSPEQTAADELIAGLVRAFSPVALGSALVLVLSGAFRAWSSLGTVAALWSSGYGRVFLLKMALLFVTLGTGAYNWRSVLPRLGHPDASARLRRSSRIELGAALLVLIVTAVLVATPMPTE